MNVHDRIQQEFQDRWLGRVVEPGLESTLPSVIEGHLNRILKQELEVRYPRVFSLPIRVRVLRGVRAGEFGWAFQWQGPQEELDWFQRTYATEFQTDFPHWIQGALSIEPEQAVAALAQLIHALKLRQEGEDTLGFLLRTGVSDILTNPDADTAVLAHLINQVPVID